jgi:CBS-domain-containing membrane protein
MHVPATGVDGLPTSFASPAFQPSVILDGPTLASLADVFDIYKNGRTLLAAAGGLALAFVGLRTIFASRS